MTTEATTSDLSDIDKKIIRQIEYYFGDVNLPKDKFLQDETKKDDGWVKIETLLTFNRLKSLSSDASVIAEAMKKSTAGVVEVSEDNSKVRRSKSKPVPENRLEFWKQTKTRTVYVKGFPQDAQLDQLLTFFANYGKVDNVMMRRTRDGKKIFKGSVMVTFETRDLCDKFLALDSVKYGETELIKMFESDYFKKKGEERKAEKAKVKEAKKQSQNQAEKTEDKPQTYTKGLVVHFTGFPENNTLNREDIKSCVEPHGQVEWIDFNRGQSEAFVRFSGEENSAEQVLAKFKEACDGQVKLHDVECQVEVLSGDAEKTYWEKNWKAKKEALQRRSQKHKGGKGKTFKGNRRDRNQEKAKNGTAELNSESKGTKRPADSTPSDSTPAKAVKTD